MPSFKIEDFGEKGIILKGDTKEYKEQIKARFSKSWNPEHRGWVVVKSKRAELEQFLKEIKMGKVTEDGGKSVERKDENRQENKKEKQLPPPTTTNTVSISRTEYLALVTRIERLEQLIGLRKRTAEKVVKIKNSIVNKEDIEEIADYEDSDEDVKPKRMLRGGKN